MNAETTTRQARMIRLSALTRGFALAIAVALPVLGAGWWVLAGDAEIAAAAGLASTGANYDVAARIAGAALSVLPVLALSWGLWRLAATLKSFSLGRPFTPDAARGLRDFGYGVLACAVLKPIAGAALSVLVSSVGPGPRALAISVSSDTLLMLLLGAVMALVGWALGEAAAIAEENAQFV